MKKDMNGRREDDDEEDMERIPYPRARAGCYNKYLDSFSDTFIK
jgi:hypothetical protein